MQNSRFVVLDCEKSTIHNGREPTCRYFMQEYVVTQPGVPFANICYALENVFGEMQEYHNITDEVKTKFEMIRNDSFENRSFDTGFTIFWSKLTSWSKQYENNYKDAFTNYALDFLYSQVQMPWKFIKRGDEMHFYYDEPVHDTHQHAQDSTIVDFDIENKFHRDEVMRVCFGPHILSTGILQFDIHGAELEITEDLFYQEFRQTPHYVHSKYVEQIHHLTERQLRNSNHDISSLHRKLQIILDTTEELTFVAHNAQQDRKWILQSIDDQIEYHKYLSCKTGVNQELEIKKLQDLDAGLRNAKWFCTMYGTLNPDGKSAGKKNGSKDQIQQPRESNTLSAVYEKITQRPLTNQHDARTDTYACALILCELLKKMDLSHNLLKLNDSKGYQRIRNMDFDRNPLVHAATSIRDSDENEGPAQSSRVVRQKRGRQDERSVETNTDKSTQTDTHGNGGVDAQTQTHEEDTRDPDAAEAWLRERLKSKPRVFLKDRRPDRRRPEPEEPEGANICYLLRELKFYCS